MKLRLPKWLRKDSLNLPPWAKVSDRPNGKVGIVVLADTDGYVREWFQLLGVDLKDADQYWLEVAYQCAKLDLQAALAGSKYDPRIGGQAAEFRFSKAPQWALSAHPKGTRGGVRAATYGKEARDHYRRVRGALPM